MKIKFFMAAIFLSLLLNSPCMAVDKISKYDDPGFTTLFERVITFENENADTLYDKCLVWCKKNFKTQYESCIDYADKKTHTIRATYTDTVNYSWIDFTTGVSGLKYDFRLDTKDGKIRMQMRLMQFRVVIPYGGYMWFNGGPKNEEKGNAEELFSDFIFSLSNEINNGDDEEW